MFKCHLPVPLRSVEDFAQGSGGVVDRCVGDERVLVGNAVSSSPCHQACNIVIRDFGDDFILPEEVNQPSKLTKDIIGGHLMLSPFLPVPVSDMVEQQGRGRALLFGNALPGLFLLDLL